MQDNDCESADLWLVNTCTVKNPSQAAMGTVIKRARSLGKKLVVSGCVPQANGKWPPVVVCRAYPPARLSEC